MSDLIDRAQGAMLGLALGDAYGRTLEFINSDQVRTEPVDTKQLIWTDDTHMVLYLTKAIVDTTPGVLVPDALGHAVGRRFVEWSHDPLTPSTAPGGTCLRGAHAYEQHGDWQRSGDPSSDGCGAVMRVLPVALAYSDEELTEAARIQAVVTHAHPNAVEAAIAGAWLVRFTMESGTIDRYAVRRVIAGLRGGWSVGGVVAEALQAAIDFADRPSVQWLDEAAIPTGDGGWRSASALGLGVASALVWGNDFATCVDRAARIHGDSDSVACLAGMLVGAAGGPQVLPRDWLRGLKDRDQLVAQATTLIHWAEVERSADFVFNETDSTEEDIACQLVASLHLAGARFVPDRDSAGARTAIKVQKDRTDQLSVLEHLAAVLDLKVHDGNRYRTVLVPAALAPLGPGDRERVHHPDARTSETDPIEVSWLDTPSVRGRIGLTLGPGKKATSAFGPPWDRDLDTDLNRLASHHDVRLLVPLLEDHELLSLQIPGLQPRAEDYGMVVHRLPIPDGGIPSLARARIAISLALSAARAGYNVCFHCRGGLGRAGTLAAMTLVRLGANARDAIDEVRKARPGAIENVAQERIVREYQVDVTGH